MSISDKKFNVFTINEPDGQVVYVGKTKQFMEKYLSHLLFTAQQDKMTNKEFQNWILSRPSGHIKYKEMSPDLLSIDVATKLIVHLITKNEPKFNRRHTIWSVSDNIYFDNKCIRRPYCLNIMRKGYRLSKSFEIYEDALQARSDFIDKISREYNRNKRARGMFIPTKYVDIYQHPISHKYMLVKEIQKTFDSKADAVRLRDKLDKLKD